MITLGLISFIRAVKPLQDLSIALAPSMQILEQLFHSNPSSFINESTKTKIFLPLVVFTKAQQNRNSFSKVFSPR